MATYQRNDRGLPIEVQVLRSGAPMDISSATTREIIIRKGATVKVFPAAFTGSGTDGLIRYSPVDGDLSPAGRWEIQAHVVGPTFNFHTYWGTLDVIPNLTD